MKATETTLHGILEISSQYVIPLFQRTYSWEQKQWETFWQDLVYLAQEQTRTTVSHFIGSIVTLQLPTTPGQIQQYTVIDGQQRLTTAQIFLLALRKKAEDANNDDLIEDLNVYLQNRNKKPPFDQKLVPTLRDQEIFRQLLLKVRPQNETALLTRAYDFFIRKLSGAQIPLEALKVTLTERFSIVSITLGQDDDPYAVFESLNGKGLPLTVGDLLRNLLFMRVPSDSQLELYERFWLPIQDLLNEKLTDFFRHFCAADGLVIRESDLYFRFRENYVKNRNLEEITTLFSQLKDSATYYHRFIHPENEPNSTLKKALKRMAQLPLTTHYPLLLNLYKEYQAERLALPQFVDCLKTLENYLVRLFIVGKSYTGLNKEFPLMFQKMQNENPRDLVAGLKAVLIKKRLPTDAQVRLSVPNERLYGAGDRQRMTRFVLYSLEEKLSGSEVVGPDAISIEHVAPQTPTDYWKDVWKNASFDEYDQLLHTLGNLTLTGYNPELSNRSFEEKRNVFTESNFRLNRYFQNPEITHWDAQAVLHRTAQLTELALETWPYFGQAHIGLETDPNDFTGKKPIAISFDGQKFQVPEQTWSSTLILVVNYIIGKDENLFTDKLALEFPNQFQQSKSIRRSFANAKLSNGWFVDSHFSANNIVKYCKRFLESAGIDSEDFEIETTEQYQRFPIEGEDFRGKKPIAMIFDKQKFSVPTKTWGSCLVLVLNHIIQIDENQLFEKLIAKFPKQFSEQDNPERPSWPLSNGWYVNGNWTSNNMIKYCKYYLETVGIDTEDFEVECF